MLRPATPLTILLLISFVFLLLSVLSTPIIKSIPIASYKGINFGVLGYCTPTECSGIRVGYTTNGLFGSSGDGDFNLPSSARQSLSSLLIVHPVAAFFNLVCLALAGAAHLHSPSHSARYLLGLLILLLPTLLVTLLAFLVDILLFVPHLQWGGWIVLASTILITASGVVTCAMRRTLVSRKARKKRIAENAEMSGENFYNRQAQETKIPGQSFAMEPTVPMVNGAPGADRLPNFATFDSSKKLDDDRQPLRSQALSNDPTLVPSRDGASDRFYGPPSRSGSRPGSRPPYDGPRDQFGNPTPPPIPVGAGAPIQGRRSGDERTPPSPYRENSVPPPGGRGYGPRGRGNYPARGGYSTRGSYGSRGPPPPQNYPGRGGFSADMRGGYGNRGRGGYSGGAAMTAAAGGVAAGAMMANGQRRPPPGYPPGGMPPDGYSERMGGQEIAQSQPYIEGENREFTPMSPSIYTTGPEDPQGVYGARAQSPGREGMSPYGARVQSPAGTGRGMSPPPAMPAMPPPQVAELSGAVAQHDFAPRRSQSQDPYVPVRSNWNNASNENFNGPRSPGRFAPLPAELPSGDRSVAGYGGGSARRPRVNSGGSDIYYEDVDPKFAMDQVPPLPQNFQDQQPRIPSLLTPGPPGQGGQYRPDSLHLPPSHSYEDLPGARSPAESETSNFTSVSQRGVNPNWRPGNGGEFNSFGPRRPPGGREQQMRRDVILANNPDFELPGMGPQARMGPRAGGGGGGRGMMMRGGMNGGAGRMPPPPSAFDGAGDGRYPAPVPPPVGPPPMNMSTGGVRDI